MLRPSHGFALFFLCITTLSAKAQFLDWVVQPQENVTQNTPSVADVEVDDAGHIHIVGSFFGTSDFDPGPEIAILETGGIIYQPFLQKLDDEGNLLWVKRLEGTARAVFTHMALTDNGNILVSGLFRGALDFDPSFNTHWEYSTNMEDNFVASYDASGNLNWVRTFTTSDALLAERAAIALDDQGNIYLSGGFTGTPDLDPGVGTTSLISVGSNDIYHMKWDATGNFLWANQTGNPDPDYLLDFEVDAAGNSYSLSICTGGVDVDPGSGTVIFDPWVNGEILLAYLQKLDPNGNLEWVRPVPKSTSLTFRRNLALDPDGNPILSGEFTGTVDFDPSSNQAELTAAGVDTDFFLLKYDDQGDFAWVNHIQAGVLGDDPLFNLWSLETDQQGTVFIGGGFFGSADFSKNGSNGSLIKSASGEGTSAFVGKYNANGEAQWVEVYGAKANQEYLRTGSQGDLYLLGEFTDTTNFSPAPGSWTLPATSVSAYLSKWDADVPTGITDQEERSVFNITAFPNPTSGQISLQLPDVAEQVQITIFDALGQQVGTKQVSGTSSVDLQLEGPSGLYLVQVRTDAGSAVVRLVKE